MKHFLKKIIDYKKLELESQMRRVSKRDIEKRAMDAEPPQNFLGNFSDSEINIIAEIKKASPSAGIIRKDFNPVEIARIYEESGAKALSILTDEHFFQGHLSFLKLVRKTCKLPILRKDFTFTPYQIYEGRAFGADAILLIVAVLDDYQLKDFHAIASELGMTALVEVHSENELHRALKLNGGLLGINNRDLNTLEVDAQVTTHLIKKISQDIPVISESGLKDSDALVKLKQEGVSGFLIGETLMKEKDIGKKLRALCQRK